MGSLVEATELSKALIEAGNKLLEPYSSTDQILSLLDETESLLATVDQDPILSVYNALRPSMEALVSTDLLRNSESDIRVSVVSCLTEIMRITAPEAPYKDDRLKEIFQVTVEAFGKLTDTSCHSYKKAEGVLEIFSKIRLALVMLDLECHDLILEMFRLFLKIISPDHSQLVLLSMEAIMITVIDESEEVSMDLLEILLTTVKKDSQDVSPMALKLVEKVISSCSLKLQPCIMEALKSTGTSLDMYSLVVSSICQSESATTQAHNVVNANENEEILEVLPSKSLENKLDLELSCKGNRSKRTAKGGTGRANGDDKIRYWNYKKQQSESTDAETESGTTRKRGRKPNSLMNPEEGYSFKTSSRKKEKSVLSPSSKGRTGSCKLSRSKMVETNHDADSIAKQTSNKRTVENDYPQEEEEDLMESILENPEDCFMTAAKSSKKEKTSAKKPLTEAKSVLSDAMKSKSEVASMDTPITQPSQSKKKNSRAASPLTKEADQTLKSHPKRKQRAEEEVAGKNDELGEELIGKKVNIWWPLDKMFYEGVIDSYCSRKKIHRVTYSDGEAEELNLMKERWEIILDKEIDLPDSIPLPDLIRQKAKKNKDTVTNSTKQVKRTNSAVKVVSKELESREGENLKSLKELITETGRSRKRQKVTRAMDGESEKDSDEKEEPETEGEDSLKDGKGSCKRDHQELFEEDPIAETETDALECNSVRELIAEPKIDGKRVKSSKRGNC